MKDSFRNSTLVRDPHAAAVFAKPLDLRFLSPFIGRTRLASEVARELGVPLSTLAYRIKKLLALELLEVAHVEKRPGSPLKHYRAVSDAFFVPFEATDAETLEVLLERWEKPWSAMFHRGYAQALSETGERWGVSVWRDETGEVRVAPAPQQEREEDVSVLDELALGLRLSREEVKGLKGELLELLQRYSNGNTEHRGSRPHLLRVMLTPLAEDKVLL